MAESDTKAQPPTPQVLQLPSAGPAIFANTLFAGVDSNKESVFLIFSQTTPTPGSPVTVGAAGTLEKPAMAAAVFAIPVAKLIIPPTFVRMMAKHLQQIVDMLDGKPQ
ncbi:MAG: hypothetical protein ABR915_15895 [Thermoguttaceae bacterium]|jgi:hypothetical protein